MSWAEVKKSINTNLSKALDVLINERIDHTDNLISWENATTKNHITQAHATTDALINSVQSGLVNHTNAHLDHIVNNKTHGLIALLNAINSIKTGGSVKVIKSVQRGHVAEATQDDDVGITVPISIVDPNKSIVIINFDATHDTNGDDVLGYKYSLSATELHIPSHAYEPQFNDYYRTPAFSWQVIEFY